MSDDKQPLGMTASEGLAAFTAFAKHMKDKPMWVGEGQPMDDVSTMTDSELEYRLLWASELMQKHEQELEAARNMKAACERERERREARKQNRADRG